MAKGRTRAENTSANKFGGNRKVFIIAVLAACALVVSTAAAFTVGANNGGIGDGGAIGKGMNATATVATVDSTVNGGSAGLIVKAGETSGDDHTPNEKYQSVQAGRYGTEGSDGPKPYGDSIGMTSLEILPPDHPAYQKYIVQGEGHVPAMHYIALLKTGGELTPAAV